MLKKVNKNFNHFKNVEIDQDNLSNSEGYDFDTEFKIEEYLSDAESSNCPRSNEAHDDAGIAHLASESENNEGDYHADFSVNEPTKKPKRSRKKKGAESKPRIKRPDQWKQNVRSRLCQSGLPYVDKNGNERPGRAVGPPCNSKCPRACPTKITATKRQDIHKYFWNLSASEKRVFYENHIRECDIQRRAPGTDPSKKTKFHRFYFENDDDCTVQVCQQYFLNTLGISMAPIRYFFKNFYEKDSKNTQPKPHRGRKGLTEEQRQEILDHIASFPSVESQKCQCLQTRRYLDPNLNITRMYNLFKEGKERVFGIDTYRKLFHTCFNYSFNLPKKDVCNKCLHTMPENRMTSADNIKLDDTSMSEYDNTESMQDSDMEVYHCENSSSSLGSTLLTELNEELRSDDDSECVATMNLIKLSDNIKTSIFPDNIESLESASDLELSLSLNENNVVGVSKSKTSAIDVSCENSNGAVGLSGKKKSVMSQKRTKNPEQWKQNVRSRLRQKGLPYIDTNGMERPAKAVGPSCDETCRRSCSERISARKRQDIHAHFWNLSSLEKRVFYENHIEKCDIQRRTPGANPSRKNNFFRFYLENDDDLSVQVCKQYFLNTLSISSAPIKYFFENFYGKPRKIPCQGRPGTSEERLQKVFSHIASFPSVASQKCQCAETRKYLDSSLNITKMYNLYKGNVDNPVGIDMYRKMFHTRFNYSFNPPQKDICSKCFHTSTQVNIKIERNIDATANPQIDYERAKTKHNSHSESENFMGAFLGFLGSDPTDETVEIIKADEQSDHDGEIYEEIFVCDEESDIEEEYVIYEEHIDSDE